jgi:hypothetical protein
MTFPFNDEKQIPGPEHFERKIDSVVVSPYFCPTAR